MIYKLWSSKMFIKWWLRPCYWCLDPYGKDIDGNVRVHYFAGYVTKIILHLDFDNSQYATENIHNI